MRVLGVDPGLGRCGWGCVDRQGSRITVAGFGLIETPANTEVGARLVQIRREFLTILETYQPDALTLERLIFARNVTTAMDVAKAVGVVWVTAAERGLPINEFTPAEIKQSVVGNGRAEKKQVEFMVTRLLGLEKPPRPDDVADALAVALTGALRRPIS